VNTTTTGEDESVRQQWLNALRSVRKRPKKERIETSIQRSILRRLELLPYVKIERNNRGAKGGGRVRFGLGDGAADLVGLVEGGRFFALEVKRPGERLEANQEKWAGDVRSLGGYVGVVTSVEEALRCVEEARLAA
jgi:hypothetical protein